MSTVIMEGPAGSVGRSGVCTGNLAIDRWNDAALGKNVCQAIVVVFDVGGRKSEAAQSAVVYVGATMVGVFCEYDSWSCEKKRQQQGQINQVFVTHVNRIQSLVLSIKTKREKPGAKGLDLKFRS